MNIEWNLIWGIGAVFIGVYWVIKRSVPVGIEGRKSSYIAKGKYAVLLGITAIIIGLYVATNP